MVPPGGGKSLCDQLPALLLGGTTIVVSPLIALMKDQIDFLQRRGIDAAREVFRRRKAGTAVDPHLADTDALLLGFLLERLGRHPEAAEAMIDYATEFGGNLNNASIALDNAGTTLAIGAQGEDGDGSVQTDNSVPEAGAVFIFTRSGWR